MTEMPEEEEEEDSGSEILDDRAYEEKAEEVFAMLKDRTRVTEKA